METQLLKQQNKLSIPGAIVIAGVIIAGAVYLSASKNTNTPTLTGNDPASAGQSSVNIVDVDIENEPFIGNPNAPVTLAYWGDFQCPFCKSFDTNTLPILVRDYVETGKLKIVFKDFQFLGPDSTIAGLTAKAIWELYPDFYFTWHMAMFEAQDQEHGGFGNRESIIELTKTIPGIDVNAVFDLVDEKQTEYQTEQDEDRAEGAKFGINGTPGFVIGNQTISGAQPIGVFTQVIDAELNKIR